MNSTATPQPDAEPTTVDMPRATAAPLVLALGMALLAGGWALSLAFAVVGAVVLIAGLAMWIEQLLPGRGHALEPVDLAAVAEVKPRVGAVQPLGHGMPGYRLRLPEKIHPISAGIKGGLLGGLVMPLPAVIYALLKGYGIWLPLNLLAGMALPGVERMPVAELERFSPLLTVVGVTIHLTVALVFGLLYGVLMPTLPNWPKPLAWGALLMPLMWTAGSFVVTSLFNPAAQDRIEWPWFVVSQFMFGVIAALVVMRWGKTHEVPAGLCGGAVGGVLMAAPAMLWGYFSGRGIWFPVNVLAVMILPGQGELTTERLGMFDSEWFLAASLIHAALSLTFGLIYGLSLRRLPRLPAAFVWGALLMPLLWTATSYGFMGIVNPALQDRVDWPWFVASQFVFGMVAALVVVRSEEVYVEQTPPGPRRERTHDTTWRLDARRAWVVRTSSA